MYSNPRGIEFFYLFSIQKSHPLSGISPEPLVRYPLFLDSQARPDRDGIQKALVGLRKRTGVKSTLFTDSLPLSTVLESFPH
jgi:hypothetical protein